MDTGGFSKLEHVVGEGTAGTAINNSKQDDEKSADRKRRGGKPQRQNGVKPNDSSPLLSWNNHNKLYDQHSCCCPGSATSFSSSLPVPSECSWRGDLRLVSYDDLPSWRQHNPFILSGYRVNCESYAACIRSCFFPHNELLNIWSHALGLLAFVTFFGVTYGYTLWASTAADDAGKTHRGSYVDGLIFAPFLTGATFCLLMSTLYHTFEPCGKRVSLGWAKADYVGITILIWGSYFPVVHYLFVCRWLLQVIYLSVVTLLSIGVTIVSIFDVFAAKNVHWYRALLFTSLGLSGLAPILHFTATHQFEGNKDNDNKLFYLIAMGVFYLIGAAFYATRIPERFFPGSCLTDMVHSHFIFHMLINAGAVCHWMGSVYDFRHEEGC